jgi:hypothetical protein
MIGLILFSICEGGYCYIANSVYEECEEGIAYYGELCMMCEEGNKVISMADLTFIHTRILDPNQLEHNRIGT